MFDRVGVFEEIKIQRWQIQPLRLCGFQARRRRSICAENIATQIGVVIKAFQDCADVLQHQDEGRSGEEEQQQQQIHKYIIPQAYVLGREGTAGTFRCRYLRHQYIIALT